jgi:phosphoglycolate phosphatase
MRAVVFDLDGTLVDSDPDILAAINRVLVARGITPLTHAELGPMIGDGAKVLVERAFAARQLVGGPDELAAFLEDYNANAVVHTKPYPGMIEALETLRTAGHRMAVCTNKPEAPAREILATLDLLQYFDVVVGGDSTPFRKPHPGHLAAVLELMGVSDAVMVGDHDNDMKAAAGLELPSIFAAWGYGRSAGTYQAAGAADLPDIISRI